MPKLSKECDTPILRADEEQEWVRDVVCGMDVAPNTTPFQEHYKGDDYYFCCASCLTRFVIDPVQFVGE